VHSSDFRAHSNFFRDADPSKRGATIIVSITSTWCTGFTEPSPWATSESSNTHGTSSARQALLVDLADRRELGVFVDQHRTLGGCRRRNPSVGDGEAAPGLEASRDVQDL